MVAVVEYVFLKSTWTSDSGLSIEANYYMWGGFAENHFKVVPILISPRSPLIYPDSDSCLESGNKSDPSRWLLKWKLSIHNCFQYTRDKQDFCDKLYKVSWLRCTWRCWWGQGPPSSRPGPRWPRRARPWTSAAAQRAALPPLTSSGTWRWARDQCFIISSFHLSLLYQC